MGTRKLMIVAVAAALAAGCSASTLKSQKDDGWARVSQTLPDGKYIYNPSLPMLTSLPDPSWVGADTNPNAYGHPFRIPALVAHPIGVALDWALMRPFYMLGGLAPEWFGLTTDDGQGYQAHMPELFISKDAPRMKYE